MGLASGITSVPNAAIVLAIPTLHQQLDASTTELQWTVTGYLLAYSGLLRSPPAGSPTSSDAYASW